MTNIKQYIPYLILVVTAMNLSRGIFYLFNDPEGPNLLIVSVFAAIIFAVSLGGNYFHSGTFAIKGTTRIIIAIVVQIIAAAILYFFLK
jgi:hypothetical protein